MSLKKEKITVDGKDDDKDAMIKILTEKIEELNKKIEAIKLEVRHHDIWIKSEIELRNFQDEMNLRMYDLD